MDRLRDKVALITGGAGSIGSATARLFVAEGARVVLTDVEQSPLDGVVAELGGEEVAVGVAGDCTDAAHIEKAVRTAVERFGQLDVAFANAGIFGAHAEIVDYPDDVFDRTLSVHVRGAFLVLKYALREMQEGGSAILTSSVVGVTSAPGIAGYATAKHAMVGLMRTAAKEMAPRGIRVNSIHPGPVDNEFQHTIEKTATGQTEDKATEIFDSMIPLGRHARPDEIARSVLYLASDDSSFMTGHTLVVDGGLSI